VNSLSIAGGLLVDGTGAPRRPADLLVSRGRVQAIARPGALPAAAADRRIDATGRIVVPGFVDLHSHGDLLFALEDGALRRRLLLGRIAQGITTEVVGNCGLGPAPVDPAHEGDLRGIVAWMSPIDQPWPWRTVGGYLDRLESLGVPINVAALVAHGALRVSEAGLARRLPSPGSIASIARALDRSLEEGAFGMSLGLIYPPGSFTPSGEIAPLASVLARRDAILTAHIRGSSETLLDAVEEILAFGRETGVRVHHSHSEAVGPGHWPSIPRVLEMEASARRGGARVTFDMFPYTAAATTMAAIYPPWALEGGLRGLASRLRDGAARARMRRDLESAVPSWPPWGEEGWAHNLVRAAGWERITVGAVATEAGRWAEGLDLAELARRAGCDPFEAISDLMVAEEGRVSQIIHGISGDASDDRGLVTLLADPHGAVCTDANDTGRGLPHPAAYGTYPRVLGHFTRDRRVLTLEEAIRKTTSYPASILGLKDRGVVREGAPADLVIFDEATIGSDATFAEPRRLARGIDCVIVNGEVMLEGGRLAPSNPGKILRR
jgi:N-acyl-D-aspartate/D-glutamate deacylase